MLEIGCGFSGRFVELLRESSFQDIVRRAKLRHPEASLSFYAVIGEAKLLELLSDCHLRLRQFESDQYPEKNLVLIV